MNIFKKLFFLNAWCVGYRIVNNDTLLPMNEEKARYDLVPISDSKYYADPFIFNYNNKTYLFAEYMNRYSGKGTIAVSEYKNGKFGRFCEVLNEPFHLSYPNVFTVDNQIFMIPETSAAGQIRLYKSVEFPYKWELDTVLLDEGKPYVDSSLLFSDDGNIYLYVYWIENNEKHSKYYLLDIKNRRLISTEKIKICNERPAGNPFVFENKNLRAVQNCDAYYGKSMYIVDVGDNENIIGEVSDKNFILLPEIKKITGTHTFNRYDNFEVIDIRYDRFCITRPIIRIFQLIKKIWK